MTPQVLLYLTIQLQVLAAVRPFCVFAQAFLAPFAASSAVNFLRYVRVRGSAVRPFMCVYVCVGVRVHVSVCVGACVCVSTRGVAVVIHSCELSEFARIAAPAPVAGRY